MPYTARVDEALRFLVVLLSHHRRQKGSDSRGDPSIFQGHPSSISGGWEWRLPDEKNMH